MEIRVKGYLTFRDVIGDLSIQENEPESYTLKHLLEKLTQQFKEKSGYDILDSDNEGVRENIAVLLNGIHYSHLPDKLETELKDGDEVAIFPPIAGGAQTP
jgi:molybdopterin synthase sulfur carrier subunit